MRFLQAISWTHDEFGEPVNGALFCFGFAGYEKILVERDDLLAIETHQCGDSDTEIILTNAGELLYRTIVPTYLINGPVQIHTGDESDPFPDWARRPGAPTKRRSKPPREVEPPEVRPYTLGIESPELRGLGTRHPSTKAGGGDSWPFNYKCHCEIPEPLEDFEDIELPDIYSIGKWAMVNRARALKKKEETDE